MIERGAGQSLPDGVVDVKDLKPNRELEGLRDQAESGTDLLPDIGLPAPTCGGQTLQPRDGEPVLLGSVDHPVVELGIRCDLLTNLTRQPDVVMFEENDPVTIRTG